MGYFMKNWWKSFFKPITGEVMFKPRHGKQSQAEVNEVLNQLGNPKHIKMLDLCCGEGRHSLLFSKKGHEVIGLDYSNNFLKEARKQASKSKSSVKFLKGDMKKTSTYFKNHDFDVVVSLYNSFGYFDKRKDDLQTLKEVNKVLKSKGHFIINTLNGDSVVSKLEKSISMGYEISKNLFMIDKAHIDLKKMRTHSDWTIIDARKNKTAIFRGKFGQNVYTHKELSKMLKVAGFKVVKTWGILKGGDFDEKKSWHQTILAQKIK